MKKNRTKNKRRQNFDNVPNIHNNTNTKLKIELSYDEKNEPKKIMELASRKKVDTVPMDKKKEFFFLFAQNITKN